LAVTRAHYDNPFADLRRAEVGRIVEIETDFISSSATARPRAGFRAAAPAGASALSSAMVFQLPHASHLPDHFAAVAPHD